MKYLPHVITVLVAMIPAIISYFAARQQGKSDLKKQSEANKAELERVMKQHEIDIVHLREKHKMELEIKALEHEQKLQLLERESSLKSNEQEQSAENNLMGNMLDGLLPMLLETPEMKKKMQEVLSQHL